MASFSVVNNIAAANAQANMQSTSVGLNRTLGRLSSGYRINTSGDDAAGLAVANQYRNEQAILNQGVRNANDGMSQLQLLDGALSNVSTLVDRLATLATQASSSSNGADVTKLSDEYAEILTEIDRQMTVVGLDAAYSYSVFVSSEATAADGIISGTITAADTTTLGLTSTSFATAAAAQTALGEVQGAVSALADSQNTIGALMNRTQFAIGLAQSQTVNKRAAESRIRDANVAEESANLTRYNILQQSGIAALAQANQSSSAVLSLLR
ncbi:MAG: flagellin [Vicinamibacterales bacterium]|jgi:flagellin